MRKPSRNGWDVPVILPVVQRYQQILRTPHPLVYPAVSVELPPTEDIFNTFTPALYVESSPTVLKRLPLNIGVNPGGLGVATPDFVVGVVGSPKILLYPII